MKTYKIYRTCRLWLVFTGLVTGMVCCHDEEGMLQPSGPELNIEDWLTGGKPELDRRVRDIYDRTGVVVRYRWNEDEPYIMHNQYFKAWTDTSTYIDTWYSTMSDDVSIDGDSVYIENVAYVIGETKQQVTTGTLNVANLLVQISVNDFRDSIHYVVSTLRTGYGVQMEQPDEEYVEYQLDLLEKIYLSARHKDHMMMPNVIFLGKNLRSSSNLNTEIDFRYDSRGPEHLYFGRGDSTIATWDTKKKTTLKNNFCTALFNPTGSNNTPTFDAVLEDTVYYVKQGYFKMEKVTNEAGKEVYDYYAYGWPTQRGCTRAIYFNMVLSTTYEDLIGEPPSIYYDSKYIDDFRGCLNPKRDRNGLIRRAYDALIKDLQDAYGINLQEIGDAVIE